MGKSLKNAHTSKYCNNYCLTQDLVAQSHDIKSIV